MIRKPSRQFDSTIYRTGKNGCPCAGREEENANMTKRAHMDLYAVGDHGEVAKTVSEYDIYAFAGIVGEIGRAHV